MLAIFMSDVAWEAMCDTGRSAPAYGRDVWALCPACSTTHDYSILKRRFVLSGSNDSVRALLGKTESRGRSTTPTTATKSRSKVPLARAVNRSGEVGRIRNGQSLVAAR